MSEVVLLYQRSCPSVVDTRLNLVRAFSVAKLPASWREIDLDAADTPLEWRAFGSPTVLVDGIAVGGAVMAEGACCRLYEGLSRAPAIDKIVTALLGGTT